MSTIYRNDHRSVYYPDKVFGKRTFVSRKNSMSHARKTSTREDGGLVRITKIVDGVEVGGGDIF